MECKRHGINKPAFICNHLQYGVGIGFNEPDEESDSDYPFKEAWCNACDAMLMEQGE
jgi:hypothetical protein